MSHIETEAVSNCRRELRHTYEWVMLHIWVHHVTYWNASCHSSGGVMSHVWMRQSHIRMRHITRIWMCYSTNMNAPFHKWWSHVTRMNAPCHTYQCAMSHICMRRVTHINAPCRTCVHATSNIERSTSHIWILHVTCMYTGILKLEKWWHT